MRKWMRFIATPLRSGMAENRRVGENSRTANMARTTSPPTAVRNTKDGFRLLFGSVESLRRGRLTDAAEQSNTPSRFRRRRGTRRID